MQGRYGPYVTDGVTNASLPRDVTVEEMTFEYALNLLKNRAAAGPSKRAHSQEGRTEGRERRPAKKAAGKKAARKKKA